jgi:hypothetical protein
MIFIIETSKSNIPIKKKYYQRPIANSFIFLLSDSHNRKTYLKNIKLRKSLCDKI